MATKSILLSIKPEWVAKILNGEKTIEVRKKFPKDYVGWVYIYCTKNIGKHGENQLLNFFKGNEYFIGKDIDNYNPNDICYLGQNGKVVGRFWCDKVARFTNFPSGYETYVSGTFPNIKVMKEEKLLKLSCLSKEELRKYIPCDKERTGYAIHISKLEVFEKPKELKEFYKVGAKEAFEELEADLEQFKGYLNYSDCSSYYQTFEEKYRLQKAPQSYMFIEDSTTI